MKYSHGEKSAAPSSKISGVIFKGTAINRSKTLQPSQTMVEALKITGARSYSLKPFDQARQATNAETEPLPEVIEKAREAGFEAFGVNKLSTVSDQSILGKEHPDEDTMRTWQLIRAQLDQRDLLLTSLRKAAARSSMDKSVKSVSISADSIVFTKEEDALSLLMTILNTVWRLAGLGNPPFLVLARAGGLVTSSSDTRVLEFEVPSSLSSLLPPTSLPSIVDLNDPSIETDKYGQCGVPNASLPNKLTEVDSAAWQRELTVFRWDSLQQYAAEKSDENNFKNGAIILTTLSCTPTHRSENFQSAFVSPKKGSMRKPARFQSHPFGLDQDDGDGNFQLQAYDTSKNIGTYCRICPAPSGRYRMSISGRTVSYIHKDRPAEAKKKGENNYAAGQVEFAVVLGPSRRGCVMEQLDQQWRKRFIILKNLP